MKFGNDKIKIEGLKRKRRRMKLKAKGNNEEPIEKFNAQSCKTVSFAKSIVKKKDNNSDSQNAQRQNASGPPNQDAQSVATNAEKDQKVD